MSWSRTSDQEPGEAGRAVGSFGVAAFHIVPPTPHAPIADVPPNNYHLRPSLRSHRSASSVGSADSRFSTSWLTSDSSDTDLSLPLSIDPKLFQNRRKDDLETARPNLKSPRPPKEKKKVSHARKQDPEHIPRPRNAFILFRKHVVDSKLIPPSVEMRHQNVSVIVAKMWSEAGAEQKAHFNQLAKIEKEEHSKKYPGYRYQPVYRRTNVIRRRVRKDDVEEEKCRSVAELLLKGKRGEALETEIKEKIRVKAQNKSANELSKGAIRALRAQARSTPSIDWSDVSSASRAESPTGSSDVPQDHDTSYWAVPDGPMPQTFAYPQSHSTIQLAQPPMHMYPQPALPTSFYTFDQALPFSPTGTSFQTSGPLESNQDLLLGGAYLSTTYQYGPRLELPVASQWDRSLPPSSEIPFESLGFDGEDLLLQDFGAALAQATHDEVGW